MSTTRVVQWATGAVGLAQLREIVDRPDLELVGLFVYDPAKVGVDAGDAGRPSTDWHRGDERQGGDPGARCRRRAPRCEQGLPREHEHRRHRGAARVGQERHHHDVLQPPAHVRRRRRRPHPGCLRTGRDPVPRRRRASGLHVRAPRDVADRVVAASGHDHRAGVRRLLRRVRAARCSSISWGWGSGPRTSRSSRRCSVPCPCSTSRRSAPRPTCWDWSSTRSATRSRPARHPTTSRSPAAPCPPAPSWARSCRGPGTEDGAPVLVAQEYWMATDDIPGWDLELEGTFLVRVIVEGAPSLRARPHHRQRHGRRPPGHVRRAAGGRHDRGAGHPRRAAIAAGGRRPARVRRIPMAGRRR